MSRPTLVLLHAFGASAKAWDGVIDHLGGRFEIAALNLPGFGGAADDLHADSVHDYAAWVSDEIGRRALDRFVLVGWSMGAKIALACALRDPAGLQALVLVAPSPPGPEPMTAEARQAEHDAFGDPPAARKALQQVAGNDVPNAALEAAVTDRMAARRSAWDFWLDVGSREDITQAVEGLDIPILVITGDQDQHLGPAAAAEHVTPQLPNVSHRVVAGSGHLIPYEAPAALAAELISRLLDGDQPRHRNENPRK
jgi:pimeloyl-ACP methyl ester carboxylesterase